MLSADEIAAAANNYLNVPDGGVDMPDRVLWWTLRSVYEDYRRGVISLQAAKELKRRAIMQHHIDAGQLATFRELAAKQAERWMAVEAAAREYALGDGRTPQGDALYAAMYGNVLKEVNE